MPPKRPKLPRSLSSLRIKRAVGNLKAMTMADRVQLLVQAKLMTQDEADRAKRKLAEDEVVVDVHAADGWPAG